MPSAYSIQTREAAHSLPAHHVRCDFLRAARLPAHGVTCHATFRPGRRCFTIFAACAIPGTWFRLLTALREAERERVGRNAQPSAAISEALIQAALVRLLLARVGSKS